MTMAAAPAPPTRLGAAGLVLALVVFAGVASAQDPRFSIEKTVVHPAKVKPGDAVTIRVRVTAKQPASGVNVDLEVKDRADTKVAQKIFENQTFAAGQTRTYDWKWDVPKEQPAGEYVAKAGVFEKGWGQPVAWSNDGARITVAGGPASASSAGSAARGQSAGKFDIGDTTIDPDRVRAGQNVRIETKVRARDAAEAVHVDVEIKDEDNNKVAQRIFKDQDFDAGQSRTYQWNWRAPSDLPPGEYTVKVGVFDQRWQELAAWDNAAGDVQVRERPAPRATNREARVEETLGVELRTANRTLANRFGLKEDLKGVIVTEVRPDSPGARAGLTPGDVIREANDRRLADVQDLDAAIQHGERRQGDLRLRIERDGRERELVVKP
jgi:PDZ domain/Wzt C-terminal domain